MYTKNFLCLANSWKPPSGRCLAGKEVVAGGYGGWVRPVSARVSREVSEEERLYSSGKRAGLLDIVTVQFLRPEPIGHQIENNVLNDKVYFGFGGRGAWSDVQACIDEYDPAFWRVGMSTQLGVQDKILAAYTAALGSSLKLIAVPSLTVHVADEHNNFEGTSKRKVRGEFQYGGQTYKLSLTDPEANEQFLGQGLGMYSIDNPVLCISIVEVWNGYAFRVIASVMTPERCAG
jgi:hypothetical protein